MLAPSVVILNENGTLRHLPCSQETPADADTDRHAASSPSKGQEPPCSKPLARKPPKSTRVGQFGRALRLSRAAQPRQGKETVTQQARHGRTSPWGLCLTSPPPRPDRSATSSLATPKDVRNPPASQHAHAVNWYDERDLDVLALGSTCPA